MKVISHLSLLKLNCRVHSRLPMVPIHSQINPFHILPTPVVKILFNSTLTRASISVCISSKQVPTGTPYSFLSFPYFTTPLPFHSPQTDHPSNNGCIKRHETPHYAISSTPCHSLPLMYKVWQKTLMIFKLK